MMQNTVYRLGEYKIIEDEHGDLWWETHIGLGSLKSGKCFINGDILFIKPSDSAGPGFLKGEFLDHINKLPKWEKTKYYCASYKIHECKSGSRKPLFDGLDSRLKNEAILRKNGSTQKEVTKTGCKSVKVDTTEHISYKLRRYHGSFGIESRAPGKFDQSNDYRTQAAYLIERRLTMKNCARHIICAISLFLTLSLIFDAFADDDRYRKRHRYRGGSEKIDDDNDDNDRNDYLKPVTNQTYKEICGECHFAYQPELLPSASWLKILNQLDDHFEEEIEADPDTIKTISDYLKTNGAENSSAKRSKKIMRSLGNQVPMRISDIPYIREKHHELDPAIFKRESVGSLANCTACHITAEKGIYDDDDDVKIPK